MGSVKENLIAARALIDTPEKWIKGWSHEDGQNCAATACNEFSTAPAMFAALGAALPNPGGLGAVFAFNDHPDTTHADILALYDRAIAAQDGAA